MWLRLWLSQFLITVCDNRKSLAISCTVSRRRWLILLVLDGTQWQWVWQRRQLKMKVDHDPQLVEQGNLVVENKPLESPDHGLKDDHHSCKKKKLGPSWFSHYSLYIIMSHRFACIFFASLPLLPFAIESHFIYPVEDLHEILLKWPSLKKFWNNKTP